MDIEYAIKELRDSYELHQLMWAKRCLDTIEDELEKKDKEIEKLSKLLYLCTPEIPQCQHGKYISYVDLVKKLEKKDKIIDLMAENIADSSNVYENLVNTEFQHTKEEVIEYFTNKVEEE